MTALIAKIIVVYSLNIKSLTDFTFTASYLINVTPERRIRIGRRILITALFFDQITMGRLREAKLATRPELVGLRQDFGTVFKKRLQL
jgi:hypothetical protein